jgi:glycosyltransferase involved in cell wall biosynthesis
MPRPLLSILIPTRNRAGYLRYAIQSALNIPSNNIEIIVSENHSQDASLEVAQGFSDKRYRVVSPDKPLPMHSNWEFLLDMASGQWVYFLGDDDALMPHCADYLSYISQKYPRAEALVTARPTYFWDGCQEKWGRTAVDISFSHYEVWDDSKRRLQQCLDGDLDYTILPQFYSGGFQRRSLIKRVLATQNGKYFRSVTPDAYSAVMGCVHTYRYLSTGMPVAWVGLSPHQALKGSETSSKNRDADFYGMINDDELGFHDALGHLTSFTLQLVLYEAYVSAFPLTPCDSLSMDRVREVYLKSVEKFRSIGDEFGVEKISRDLGFTPPPLESSSLANALIKRLCALPRRVIRRAMRELSRFNGADRLIRDDTFFRYQSCSHVDHPTILSFDDTLQSVYCEWKKTVST